MANKHLDTAPSYVTKVAFQELSLSMDKVLPFLAHCVLVEPSCPLTPLHRAYYARS